MTITLTFISMYDGRTDYEVCDRRSRTTERVRVRDGVMRRCAGASVPQEWVDAYNALKADEYAAACAKYAGNPDVLRYLETRRPTPVVSA